ncbi:MAG TPA: NTP transferase domain-containing protein [Pseudomonadales bacterium]
MISGPGPHNPGMVRMQDATPRAVRVRWRRRRRAVDVAGLVLAGGRGTRFGGRDKGLLRRRGRAMARRAAALLAPVCRIVIVSANRNLSRYARWADVVVADGSVGAVDPVGAASGRESQRQEFAAGGSSHIDRSQIHSGAFLGPLAGIAAALAAVRCRILLVCPCDADDVPTNVPARLLLALRRDGRADAAVVRDPERRQPLLMALRARRRGDLERYLAAGGRSVQGWLEGLRVVEVRVAKPIGNRNTGEARQPGARQPGARQPGAPSPGPL